MLLLLDCLQDVLVDRLLVVRLVLGEGLLRLGLAIGKELFFCRLLGRGLCFGKVRVGVLLLVELKRNMRKGEDR